MRKSRLSKFFEYSKTGFTYVEIIVVFVILSIFLLVASRVFLGARRSTDHHSSQLVLQMEARRAADLMISNIRAGTEVIRPHIGETTPFLVLKDNVNNITMLYLDKDQQSSDDLERQLFRLILYNADHSGIYDSQKERVLLGSISKLSFTSTSPASIQTNIVLAGENQDYQFITHLGLMDLGT